MPNQYSILTPNQNLLLSSFHDKKLTKHQILSISLLSLLTELNKKDSNIFLLKMQGYLILGFVKIHSKKIKYILDDLVDLLKVNKPVKHRVRQLPTLKLYSEFDSEIDFESSIFEKHFNEFNNYHSEVEIVRNDSECLISFENNLSGNNFENNNFERSFNVSEKNLKRRRIVDNDIYLKGNCMMKYKKRNNEIEQRNEIFYAPELMELFSRPKNENLMESIEIARNDSVCEFDDFVPNLSESNLCLESVSDEYNFKIENLPTTFCFNKEIEDLERKDKAKAFLDLLNYCNSGRITVNQEIPYGMIFCTT
ncbi:sister chromatid cohesion protein 1 [Gurleya vavrai]